MPREEHEVEGGYDRMTSRVSQRAFALTVT